MLFPANVLSCFVAHKHNPLFCLSQTGEYAERAADWRRALRCFYYLPPSHHFAASLSSFSWCSSPEIFRCLSCQTSFGWRDISECVGTPMPALCMRLAANISQQHSKHASSHTHACLIIMNETLPGDAKWFPCEVCFTIMDCNAVQL